MKIKIKGASVIMAPARTRFQYVPKLDWKLAIPVVST